MTQILSINPANGREMERFESWDETRIEQALDETSRAATGWAGESFAARASRLRAVAGILRARAPELARLITEEMGKPVTESDAEIEKCAQVCEYYAEHGEAFLADEPIQSDADRSFVTFPPLGTVLAIMPWNFPFWQVF
ncbi:MAG: aldehyde dehydrogenase family protein, partial [Gammaproteobacteria bacterium]|nr:aldehyde dehydrogenase family protein [Gammaproteobacteria bacterium]